MLVQGVSILQASLTSSSALTAGISHLLTKVAGENWVINDIVLYLGYIVSNMIATFGSYALSFFFVSFYFTIMRLRLDLEHFAYTSFMVEQMEQQRLSHFWCKSKKILYFLAFQAEQWNCFLSSKHWDDGSYGINFLRLASWMLLRT